MSLKEELKARLFEVIAAVHKTGKEKMVVMIVDLHTSKILSSCARMHDVMEAGVLVMQNISVGREPLPDMAGLYLLEPSESSVNALCKDFEKKEKPQYKHAWLYFTSRVPDNLFAKIKATPGLLPRVKTFTEINVDFVAAESKCFHLGQAPSTALQPLYFPEDREIKMRVLREEAVKLVSLCLTTKEYPYIRYAGDGESKVSLAKLFATMVDKELKSAMSGLKGWKPSEERKRGVLLILDRSMDPVAPLMHEYTYQAMVNDLLTVDGELVDLHPDKKKKTEEDTLVLSEDDNLWVDFRHEHIGKVMEDIPQMFKTFQETNATAKIQGMGSNALIKDVAAALKDITKFKTMKRQFTKHIEMARECYGRFTKEKLMEIGEFEQDMATGLDNDGKKIVSKKIAGTLVTMCQDPTVTSLSQLRLLMIYLISQGGIREATRKELMKNIHPRLQKAVLNLQSLGVDLQVAFKGAKHNAARIEEFKNQLQKADLALMRYTPLFDSIIQDLVSGQLKESSFPYTQAPPADAFTKKKAAKTTSLRPQWRSKGPAKAATDQPTQGGSSSQRYLVYVLGGVTFSEIRSVYQISKEAKHADKALMLGSSTFLTPKTYIQGLSGLPEKEFHDLLNKKYSSDDLGD